MKSLLATTLLLGMSFIMFGCGKSEPGQPDPNLSMVIKIENAEGVGAVLNEKDREAELARAEMIVRFSK